MKKLLALFLSAVCVMGTLSACGEVTTATDEPAASGNEAGTSDASASTDVVDDYGTIVANGKMVIGITEYEPMNYYDENGTLIGFDTEFAQAICAKLGITAEFQVIDWDMKETELKSGNIDCIWNGLTVTEDRRENMDFSTSYLTNRQCVVINSANADTYTDAASLSTALITAEGGSAGESAITSDANLSQANYTASSSQADALLALKAGNYDAIVIDYTMATASAGSGDYADMMIVDGITLANEEYAIGFRLGSNMTDKVNEAISEMIADGSLAKLAAKYELTDLYEAAIAANATITE